MQEGRLRSGVAQVEANDGTAGHRRLWYNDRLTYLLEESFLWLKQ